MMKGFIYCRVLLLSAIWPAPINAFLFSGLAHSQSWQLTEAEAMRYHISHHSSLLWHQHTAASFRDVHRTRRPTVYSARAGGGGGGGGPCSQKLACRIGLKFWSQHISTTNRKSWGVGFNLQIEYRSSDPSLASASSICMLLFCVVHRERVKD